MSLAQNIASVIRRLGEPVRLTYILGDGLNKDTGERTEGVTFCVDAFGVPSRYKSSEIDGTVIQAGDLRLTLEQTSEIPKVGWLCMIDDDQYRLQDVQKVRASAETIVYICQLRAS
jgi:hypothetical protein